MNLEKVELAETGCFSPVFLDYINQKESLRPFYGSFPSPENFQKLIEARKLTDHNRNLLVEVLAEQYGPLKITDSVEFNIHSLSNPNTFTITTGHQLNIFTGPLYFIYKIVTVINACKKLKEAYPHYQFVPVYWMASEDHDAAEISYFHLFGKKYVWETDQQGAVGRFKPHSLSSLIHQLPEAVPLFEQAYLDHSTLAEAVRFYVNELFGDEGLVVLDANHKKLKSIFAPVIEQELIENTSNQLVEMNSQQLEDSGYTSQAFSREINFFYMRNGLRERIVKEGDQYKVLNTDLAYTESEIRELVAEKPELFSPNVIMRPLYQEAVLPNLAYVGGPAEIAYWLQLKGVFDHYDVNFPALMPRNFALVINKALQKKIQKLKLTPKDLFKDASVLKEAYLHKHAEHAMDALEAERNELAKIFEAISDKAKTVDASLAGFVGAEAAKAYKSLEHIAKRMKKAEEQNHETAMGQLDNIKEKLFPAGSLQERHDNFLNFYLNHPGFIRDLLEQFDPFDFRFHVLQEIN